MELRNRLAQCQLLHRCPCPMGRCTVPRIALGRTVLMHGVSSRKGAVRTRLPHTNQMSKAACLKKSKAYPELCVEELREPDSRIRRHFRRGYQHFYVATAHLPCGCGFPSASHTSSSERSVSPEDARSAERLCLFLRPFISGRNSVQLYLCWIGDEDEASRQEREVALDELGASGFRFPLREKLSVWAGKPGQAR
jgi:hypothetical protein